MIDVAHSQTNIRPTGVNVETYLIAALLPMKIGVISHYPLLKRHLIAKADNAIQVRETKLWKIARYIIG